jgi:hypothetical protein
MSRADAFRFLRILAIWSLLSWGAGRLLSAWREYHAESFDHHQADPIGDCGIGALYTTYERNSWNALLIRA